MSESPTTAELRHLQGLVELEAAMYAKLWRLAHRQQRYMTRRDGKRLTAVSRALQNELPAAQRAARGREEAVRALAERLGASNSRLQSILERADPSRREGVEAAMARLIEAADRLYDQNVQNHQLARFSLDLMHEEIRMLVGSPGEQGYGDDGHTTQASLQGLINGRA